MARRMMLIGRYGVDAVRRARVAGLTTIAPMAGRPRLATTG
jgi:hypothetical protein